MFWHFDWFWQNWVLSSELFSKCLTTSCLGEKVWFTVFANFHGVNTTTMADCKLWTPCQWMQDWEEMCTADSSDVAQATILWASVKLQFFNQKFCSINIQRHQWKKRYEGKIKSIQIGEFKWRKLIDFFFLKFWEVFFF